MTVGAVVDPATGQRRYDVEVPGNLVDLLASTVVRTPDSPAFVDAHVSVTWREFAELVEAAARGLADLGIAAGDRVGLLAGNSVPLTSAYWAIWRLGAIAVPLNHRLTSTELAAQLVDSGTRICLIGRDREELGAAATAEAGATAVVQHSESSLVDGTSGLGPTALDRATPAAILYTSGTTGRPKGVVVSHGNIIQNSVTCVEVIGRRQEDRELIMVPQFNVTGLCSQTVPVVHTGMSAVLLDGFDASKVVALVRQHRVTSTVGAPTMWWRILEAAGDERLGSLRLALFGGAPMPVALLQRMQRALPAASFGNGYGMTETCSMVTYIGGDDVLRRPDSVGRALPITELRLLHPERDQDVAPGDVGEVTVRGPQVALGYWGEAGIRPLTGTDGWLRTGDAARLDDGLVILVDRWKDVIKRGGESVYSIEIEEVLHQHPDILEAAVVGVPDETFGEQVLAVVVPKPGRTVTPDEVKAHCRASLARFKTPSYVMVRTELPRNAGGKVLKARLSKEFIAER